MYMLPNDYGNKVSLINQLFFLNIYLFIYLAALGLNCSTRKLSCGIWDLVP